MYNVLKIKHTYDETDCDHDGCSGGYCEGADVYWNGQLIYQFVPKANCFGGDHMNNDTLIKGIVQAMFDVVAKKEIDFDIEETYP